MNPKHHMIAGVLAGISASFCCVGPLVLLSLGFGGGWLAYLTAFEPARPVLLALAMLFIGLTFRQLYFVPKTCEPGQSCPDRAAIARQRLMFWVVTIPLLGLLAFPWFAPLFY